MFKPRGETVDIERDSRRPILQMQLRHPAVARLAEGGLSLVRLRNEGAISDEPSGWPIKLTPDLRFPTLSDLQPA